MADVVTTFEARPLAAIRPGPGPFTVTVSAEGLTPVTRGFPGGGIGN